MIGFGGLERQQQRAHFAAAQGVSPARSSGRAEACVHVPGLPRSKRIALRDQHAHTRRRQQAGDLRLCAPASRLARQRSTSARSARACFRAASSSAVGFNSRSTLTRRSNPSRRAIASSRATRGSASMRSARPARRSTSCAAPRHPARAALVSPARSPRAPRSLGRRPGTPHQQARLMADAALTRRERAANLVRRHRPPA